MAASINGSQSLSTTQSLAAYLQALQTKNNNPTSQGSNAVTGGAAAGTTATGAAGSCSRSFGQSINRNCPFMSSTREEQLSTQSPQLT